MIASHVLVLTNSVSTSSHVVNTDVNYHDVNCHVPNILVQVLPLGVLEGLLEHGPTELTRVVMWRLFGNVIRLNTA